jgi:hypothetical protein
MFIVYILKSTTKFIMHVEIVYFDKHLSFNFSIQFLIITNNFYCVYYHI